MCVYAVPLCMMTSVALKKMAEDLCESTLFVGNLPYVTTTSELQKLFGEIGPVKRCFVVPNKGFGYVTFVMRKDAQAAIDKVKKFGGRKLNVKFSKPKSGHVSKKPENKATASDDVELMSTLSKKEKKIAKKKNPVVKKGRLIIRNLSFKAKEIHIRQAFEKHGKVVEVVIPTKDDGNMLGFAFVQYDRVADAASAVKAMNAQKIFGRPIAVDWSVPKKRYIELTKEKSESNEFGNSAEDDHHSTLLNNYTNMSENVLNIPSTLSDIKHDDDNISASDDEKFDSCNDGSENDSDRQDEESEKSEDSELDSNTHKVHKYKNNTSKEYKSDVTEGKTLFIRNINFSTTQEHLHNTFSKFGPLYYAIICIDQLTEHSKGTGFVKFKAKDDADKCLNEVEVSKIILDGQELWVSRAVTKEELEKRAENKTKPRKDKRNLYLAREGLIRPGTLAAEGVSKQDMIKRTELEFRKRQMLHNLHIFVSKTRLCVRNLPLSVNEQQLKKIFLKAAGHEAKINEIRIMRNLKKIVSGAVGESKGYGFVGFTEHEHALQALRNTNNNPSIFTSAMRPIVEFSLENKAILKAKERRLEMSRQNNKPRQDRVEEKGSTSQRFPTDKTVFKDSLGSVSNEKSFVGTKSNASTSSKALPSHFGPKIRHKRRDVSKLSRRSIQKQKLKYREQKKKLKSLAARKIKSNIIPSKKKISRNDDKLDNLVNNYKRKLDYKEHRITKKKKWFHVS